MKKRERKSRKYYAEKFNKLYIPQDDELVMQCHEPYPPFWFISNKGRLFSVAHNALKIVDQYPEINSGTLRWHYKYIDTNGKAQHIRTHQLVAEHFKEDDFADYTEYEGMPREVHHINKTANYAPDQAESCNKADNLQILPAKLHRQLTAYSNRTREQEAEKLQKQIEKDQPVQVHLPSGGLDVMLGALVNNQDIINHSVMMLRNEQTGEAFALTGQEAVELLLRPYLERKKDLSNND